jgi:two-component system sensor histidine kinase KdpD
VAEARISRASAAFKWLRDRLTPVRAAIQPYLASAAMVIAATAVCYLIETVVAPSSLSLVFMTAVLFSAVRYGLWPSIMTSLLAELSWSFFFLPPSLSLGIEDPQDLLALILFLIVSFVASNLAAIQRRQSEAARARERTTAQLYDFSQKIAAAGYLEELLSIVPRAIGKMLTCEVALLLPGGDGLRLETAYPMNLTLSAIDLNAAHWSWGHNHPAGRGTTTLPEAEYFFLPLSTRRGSIGVVGVERASSSPFPGEERLLSIVVHQTAVAIERAQLAETIDHARLQAETERLRSAMMTSVSHDLRTPLTTGNPPGAYRPGAGGGGAARSVHRQSSGYDEAGIGQTRSEAGADRYRRNFGVGPRPRGPHRHAP